MDPAPFYLMDEVDAELDTQYREMVARLVKRQSEQQGERCQIFCTTFKPEILRVATSFYRVTVKNEASRIEKTTQEQALEFVQTKQGSNNENQSYACLLTLTSYDLRMAFCSALSTLISARITSGLPISRMRSGFSKSSSSSGRLLAMRL